MCFEATVVDRVGFEIISSSSGQERRIAIG